MKYSFVSYFYFKRRRMGSVVETWMNVLIQEVLWVLNISRQLSIIALLSPSVHWFSVKRGSTNNAVVCRCWHDPKSGVCGKVTMVLPVTEMSNY